MVKTLLDHTMHTALLGLEAQRVVGLRLMRIGAGGAAAQAEIQRMLVEKAAAMFEAMDILATGGSPEKVVRRYRTRVRANERRLLQRAR
jgi:hypothetical protein